MAKKMLIDAMHPEETRVVVTDGQRVEDFDFESKVKKSYKSNIYLAKVTRVEPSLQAAFVNYGGNRHGFLPFSEIHPDYYRIPIEDKERLMKEQEEIAKKLAERQEAEDDDDVDNDKLEEELDALIEEVNAEINGIDLDNDDDADDEKAQDGDDETSEEEDDGDDDSVDEADEEDKPKKKTRKRQPKRAAKKQSKKKDDEVSEEIDEDDESDEGAKDDNDADDADDDNSEDDDNNNGDESDNDTDENSDDKNDKRQKGRYRGRRGRRRGRYNNNNKNGNKKKFNTVGGDDIEDDPVTLLWKKMRRAYKIQEVIKRGQIVLVQCQKEERGNKGAAMTTYITLPGRYGVLMPNSPRGGGISRKIGWGDRKKLKDVLKEVTIPQGMSVILRTAAVGRTKTEIKRDLDYLYKLWDNIRELTLKSNAPALVYEEGELVKRAVRDLYTRDVDEIYVAGEQAYKETRDIMKMMIPSHVKRVKQYKDGEFPLFTRYQVEDQIDEIYNPQVSLKSGGYLVIHPTEALVSIDVNSGRSTKERNIERTALKTNIEAAEEVARQLRLRDLGGLVVIDFIDMENYKNNREVERRLTDALSKDRARVQIGRISNFGLMELSRQRLRPSLTDTHFEVCHHCQGAGTVRTKETAALRVLRKIEGEALKGKCGELRVDVPTEIGLYILNSKRIEMAEIEKRYDMSVYFVLKDEMSISEYEMTKVSARKASQRPNQNDNSPADNGQDDQSDEANNAETEQNDDESQSGDDDNNKKSSNRRGDEAQKEASEDKGSKKPARGRGRRKAAAGKKSDAKSDDEPADKADDKTKTDSSDKSDEVKADKDDKEASSKAKKPAKGRKPTKKASSKSKPAENDNDDKDYEQVNQQPDKKKKGWWNKILD